MAKPEKVPKEKKPKPDKPGKPDRPGKPDKDDPIEPELGYAPRKAPAMLQFVRP